MKEIDVYKGICQRFKENQLISAKDIKQLVRNYLIYHNLKGWVSKIIFNKNDQTTYCFIDGELNIDYSYQLEYVFDEKYQMYGDIDKIELLISLLHELQHVDQNRFFTLDIPFFNNPFITSEMKEILLVFNLDEEKYREYHDFFLFEYYAIIQSKIKIEKICLSYLKNYIDKEALYEHNCYTASNLITMYSDLKGENCSCHFITII